MSGFVLIRADASATLLRDDPIVSASDLPLLEEAQKLLSAASVLREEARRDAEIAADAARAEGFAAGHAEGLAAGAEAVVAKLLGLAKADAARADAQRGDLARLGLEVVRRIAADLGSADMVAALAEKAASTIAPDAAVTIRVPPAAVAQVRARLGDRATVEPDETLAANDCVLSTSLGDVHAGLETQLTQLARQWGVDA